MDENQPNDAPKDNSYLLPASILIAAILISGAVLYSGKNPGGRGQTADVSGGAQNLPAESADVQKISDRDVILGNPKAPVTFIEYGDYQCPFCGRFFTNVEGPLRDEYIKTNKVKMIFRNLPFLGSESTAAAEAAECAKDQNKFWAYHDALYAAEIADGHENSGNLTSDLFVKLAGGIGLDAKVFGACVASGKYAQKIKADLSSAQAAGVQSTPTTFVNGARFEGALPYSQFKAAIDKELKGVYNGIN